MLAGKKILIGVSGGIAAYKVAFLVRLLKKEKAEVRVLLTNSAKEFITPLTLSVLSENPVLSAFHEPETGEWHSHIHLGLWADVFVVAPATANTIASMAYGLCDNLLLATYLSARCPVFVAPAMDLDMYTHPTSTENIEKLRAHNVHIIDAEEGFLASGLEGKGRMAEPETIIRHLQNTFLESVRFKNKKVLVTAGPTYEPLDPVRFIGNHSSGKMGFAIAETFANQGAQVTLISGPTQLTCNHAGVKTIRVERAGEMYEEAKRAHEGSDVVVFSAAVSDYGPGEANTQKIKKMADHFELQLVKTVDIAKELGSQKAEQFHVGFALETENEELNAREKLEKKNFDMVVLNSLNNPGAGFGHDTNQVTIFKKDGKEVQFEIKSKQEVAQDIVQEVADEMGL